MAVLPVPVLQTLLRAGLCLGSAPGPVVPLHSTALARANGQALTEPAHGSLKSPPDSVHIPAEAHL